MVIVLLLVEWWDYLYVVFWFEEEGWVIGGVEGGYVGVVGCVVVVFVVEFEGVVEWCWGREGRGGVGGGGGGVV